MVRLQFSIQLSYDVAPSGCDFLFNLQAAQTRQQQVVTEQLDISQPVLPHAHTDPVTHTRFLRLKAQPGPLVVRYGATLDIQHHTAAPAQIGEVPVAELPAAVLPYLYPSRYCQSDRLHRFAVHTFGDVPPGYGRAQAICTWVQKHVRFQSNASDACTSAVDTLVEKVGVCRDFAHLMIALCRANNIPARFTTGIDYGADPALGPTDFHAYVEVFLGDRWYLFDPSGTAIPMGFVRFAIGRDAADAAFAMMFGGVVASAPVIAIQSVPNAKGQRVEPVHVSHALSTDGQEIVPKMASTQRQH